MHNYHYSHAVDNFTQPSRMSVEVPVLWENHAPPGLQRILARYEAQPVQPKLRDASPERVVKRKKVRTASKPKLFGPGYFRLYSVRRKRYITPKTKYSSGRLEFVLPNKYYPRMVGITKKHVDTLRIDRVVKGEAVPLVELELGEVDAKLDLRWYESSDKKTVEDSSESFDADYDSFKSFLDEVINTEVRGTVADWQLEFEVDRTKNALILKRLIFTVPLELRESSR